MKSALAAASIMVLAAGLQAAVGNTAPAGEPSLDIRVEHPILLLGSDPAKPVSTRLSVEALGFPAGAKLTYAWRQVQDVMSPVAADMAKGKLATLSAPAAATTEARFSGWGVYAIRLTVTDAAHNLVASRNTWVNVWDSRSHVVVDGKPHPLMAAPGLTPPPSVRPLSPDPGPFRHPRVLCTDRDWQEISRRVHTGKIAGKAAEAMRKGVETTIGDPKSAYGQLTTALAAYAASGFKGREPDLTMGIAADQTDKGPDWSKMRQNLDGYCGRLRDACLLAWLDLDPAKARNFPPEKHRIRCRRLAQATAALAHIRFRHCWTEQGGFTPADPYFIDRLDNIGEGIGNGTADFALAYDFIAPWLTEEEARDVRHLVFASGGARTTGERVVFFASGIHGRLNRGWEHNGDFVNIEENRIFASLAVEGEERGMSEAVVKAFTTAKKPDDYATTPDRFAHDWTQLAGRDGGGANPGSKPYPEGCLWPHARKVSIDNLQRQINWNDDWYVSPWGFELNREAYYGLSAFWVWPAAVAFARHGGENQFVTGYFYNTVNHLLWYAYPGQGWKTSEHFRARLRLFDGHDGGGDYRQSHIILLKYMYPDDPAVDYLYAANAPELTFSPLHLVLFGLDPGLKSKSATALAQVPELPQVAAEKKLPLTKVDPQMGVVVARSGWKEEDLVLAFDTGWIHTGHMHAEKNSFYLFALGRAWSIPPGYHIVPSNYQAGVQIRDPEWASDSATGGFIGQSPAVTPAGSRYPSCFPTPPGRLLEVAEDPQHLATLMAGDATAAYNYCCGPNQVDTGIPRSQFMYPGLLEEMVSRGVDRDGLTRNLQATPNYNPVRYAFRSILFVRSTKPYVLIVDDICKDGQPRDYRWTMNCTEAFGPPSGVFLDAQDKNTRSSLRIQPKATAIEAVLYHEADVGVSGKHGKPPRLLVRDLCPGPSAKQPTIRLDNRLEDETASNRLQIDRLGVSEPGYTILLFPHRAGDRLPATSWNADRTLLTVDLMDGTRDLIRFDRSNADHRTRLRAERIAGKSVQP